MAELKTIKCNHCKKIIWRKGWEKEKQHSCQGLIDFSNSVKSTRRKIKEDRIAQLEKENATLRGNYEGERKTVYELTKELEKVKKENEALHQLKIHYQTLNGTFNKRIVALRTHVELAFRAAQRGAKQKKKAATVRQVRGILEAAMEEDAEQAPKLSPWITPWLIGGAAGLLGYMLLKDIQS